MNAPEVLEQLQAHLSGRYRIVERLGEGGNSVVYEAWDVRHERSVALKVLKMRGSDSRAGDRFLREIRAAAKLSHPHVMPVLDSGNADGLLYYVMPRAEGVTLRDVLGNSGPLPLADAVRIIRQVADALAYAHRAGLVHRDVKPGNVLLSSGHAVVCDFGLVRALGDAGDASLTRTGTFVGTPAYMSPEQWEEETQVDGRSDQYSVGCLFYEMLTGERPFLGGSTPVILAQHLRSPVPSVSAKRAEIPENVDAVIRRAMAKDPSERFDGMEDFAAALGEPLAGEATASWSGAGSRARGRRTTRTVEIPLGSRRTVVSVVAVSIVLVGLVAGFRTWVLDRSSGPARVVVLPFEMLGPESEVHIARGVSEEITGRLAGVAGLSVIGPASAARYPGSGLTPGEFARDLGVEYVVEGSLLWDAAAADSMLLRARLLNTDEEVLWQFDTVSVAGGIMSLQTAIAERVMAELVPQAEAVDRAPLTVSHTDDLEAWEEYLLGNAAYNRSWARGDVEEAVRRFEAATAIDPDFALARARLSRAHSWMNQLRYDLSEDRLVQAKSEADRALALNPELPEARLALGLYWYWGREDFERALDEFALAGELAPSNPQVPLQIGNVMRRQGRFAEAIESYRRATELDPRDFRAWFNFGETLTFTHRYEEAEPALVSAVELNPVFLEAHVQRARTALALRGDTAEIRSLLRQAEERIPVTDWREPLLNFARILYSESDFRAILRVLRPGAFGLDSATYHVMKARLLRQSFEPAAAVVQFDSARVILDRWREERPDQAWIHGLLGLAYAGVGRSDEAVRAASRAVELLPIEEDALDGPSILLNLATVHVMNGQMEEAMPYFDRVLREPSWLSLGLLELDPTLAAFRETPYFRELVQRHASREMGTVP